MNPIPPVIILDRSQMAENIGAVARVMANFGLDRLRLVSPRDGWPQDRAWPLASGADWVLDGVQVFDSAAAAVADLTTVYAATARPRETRQPVRTPREASRVLYDDASSGLGVGLLFGSERAGLETSDIALCQGIVTIPIDPRHQSLNLAQAVAITAYEWRTLILDAPPPNFRDAEPPASGELQLGMYEHLERELDAAGFFHPPEKFRSMSQNLRVMLGRSRFTAQEVATFRGVITALSKGRGRVLERLAREKADKREPSAKASDA
ncbi:MAG: RNA methyltransferase [Brevundimonas sp.]|uniref:RNA methyltransferase n=1 Tax=Brevundimonas sp. TaxID=1871086 RepID=UPI002735ECFA|nr:RNA methyltransferase [Brevundimonas sp.]MDP3403230.1 RNA methyltransferase [Brevundimonas sp.]